MFPASSDVFEAQLDIGRRRSSIMSKWMTNIPFASVPSASLKLHVLQLMLYHGSLSLLWEAYISLCTNLIFLRMHKTSFLGSNKYARGLCRVLWKPGLRRWVTKSKFPHPPKLRNHTPSEIEGLAMTRSIAWLEGGIDSPLLLSYHSPKIYPDTWSPSLSLEN